MKKIYFLILFIAFFVVQDLWAQNAATDSTKSAWTKSGSLAFSFANVGLSNWAGGGQSSISIGIIADGKAIRQGKKSSWESAFNLAFGMARVGDNNNLFKKTDDLFLASSKYGIFLKNPTWQLTFASEIRSQMVGGYEFAVGRDGKERRGKTISNLFAPAYLRLEVGLEYKTKQFYTRLSPLSNRLTFVLNDSLSKQGAFGVTPNSKMLAEFGASLASGIDVNLMENVNFKSNLNLFAAYQNLDRVVVAWDTYLNMKINKYMNAGLATNLFYDHNVLILQKDGTSKQAIQFKHVITLNVGIKF